MCAAHWRVGDLLPLSAAAFIATHVLLMAAVAAFATCSAVLLCVGAPRAWGAAVAACALAYQDVVE